MTLILDQFPDSDHGGPTYPPMVDRATVSRQNTRPPPPTPSPHPNHHPFVQRDAQGSDLRQSHGGRVQSQRERDIFIYLMLLRSDKREGS